MISSPFFLAVVGGVLVGVAASLVLLGAGRVAGVTGIASGLVDGRPEPWRLAFLGGLLVAGVLGVLFVPERLVYDLPRSLPALAFAGVLVGVGTRLGNGCTSGHGVCGLARQSPRSMVNVLTFLVTGMIVATAVRTLAGGTL